jgi:Ca2+-binding RTX toxin-like protein
VAQAANTVFHVTAGQLAQTTFQAGGSGSNDDLYVQAFDGTDWSAREEFHVTVPANHVPVAGNDTLIGSSGADTFVFDLSALTPAQPGSAVFDRILDYDQGNNGTFDPAEGDTLDLSALLSTAYNHGNGQSVDDLVRVLENPSGTGAILQVDQDGRPNGVNWTTIARLDGVHTNDSMTVVILDCRRGPRVCSRSNA